MNSSVMRFLFDNHGVRGEIVRLKEPLQQLLAPHHYPACVAALMSELAAAACLIAATLKDGSEIMVQLRGGRDAPVKYALVNIRQDLSFYGSAALREDLPCPDTLEFGKLLGSDGVLALTIFPLHESKWQGIAAVDPLSLSATLEVYFRDSQQLPTRFFIHHDPKSQRSGGIMLQIIPEIAGNLQSLEHLGMLCATLTPEELFSLPQNEILMRLFAREQVRIFPEKVVKFQCICSRERCISVLQSLSKPELASLISKDGTSMTCQHCGQAYTFTRAELEAISSHLQ